MMKNCLLLGILLYACTSCGDFLEPKSESEYVPKNVESLNEMLIGNAYPRPKPGYALNGALTLLDDDVACNPNTKDYSSKSEAVETSRYFFTWQPDIYDKTKTNGRGAVFPIIHNVWGQYYEYILGVNAVLDYVDKMEGKVSDKILVKAQAHALRGLFYFYMVNIFGEPYNYNKNALGVPLKLNAGMEETPLARNTVDQVYKQVLSDLDEAEKYYLTLSSSEQFDKSYRTNLPMVQLLKSRVYLYMENWKQAAVYANKVINDWGLALVDLKVLNNPAKTYYQFISIDCPECIWVFGTGLDYYNCGIDIAEAAGSRKFYTPSSGLLNGFKPGDLRRKEYIMTDYNGSNVFGSKVSSGSSISTTYFGQGFRLPEAYLNLAEAAAMDNDEPTALRALNDLREKRFTQENYKEMVGVTGKNLVDSIRQERRLELCFEFHRWFDLRRYGMPSITKEWVLGVGNVQKYVLEEKDKAYTIPIPEIVMDQNKMLIQNELAPKRMPN